MSDPGSPEQQSLRSTSGLRWLRQLAKRLGLLAGTLLVLAIGAEAATRLLTDTIPPLTERDAVVGQHYLPGFQGEIYVPEAERRVQVRFNSAGFRGPDRPMEKLPNVRRVAILGDSMVASLGVEEEDTLVCRLEGMLNQSHPRWKWEVLNFGISGASPGQELVLYRELAARWQPDIVLCAFFVGNDLSDNSRRLSNNPRIYFDLDDQGRLYQVPFSLGRVKLSHYLNRHSRFYVWQRDAVNHLRRRVMNSAGVLDAGQWIFCREESADVAQAWTLSDKIHRAFDQEATRRGALFAVVVLPVAAQIYRDAFEAVEAAAGEQGPEFDWDYPDQRLGRLCGAARIPLLTMTADFRAAAPAASSQVQDEWLFYQGNGHLNQRGNELAARAVHRFLTQGDRQQVAGQALVSRLR